MNYRLSMILKKSLCLPTTDLEFVKIGRAVYALINYQHYNMKDDFLKIELNSLAHKKRIISIKSYGSQYKVQILKNGSF